MGSTAFSAQAPAGTTPAGPPNPVEGFFPLSEVHRGLMGTAWTVFTGDKPEPMQVEILGVLRGARGPGHDMILAQLHGAKPEYTGVVAGMSGSPVYIGNKLLGSLSYRIGQFSKDPIAGITPIAQMLEVRDLPASPSKEKLNEAEGNQGAAAGMTFAAMETPLVMSGFRPEAVRLWQKEMAGTGLETVAAGGSGESLPGRDAFDPRARALLAARARVVPGSAISAQLIRGDLEIAATCTVTYIDPKQLLACGHPILQAGPVSLPMTTTDVLTTLASPLNAFKIINTGVTIGAFTQDRDAAIRGTLGARAKMIPVHVTVHGSGRERKLNFDVLDLPSLTPQAVMVALYDTLLESNESTAETSYHVQGTIDVEGHSASPINIWATETAGLPSQLVAAVMTGESFNKLYSNGSRVGEVRSMTLRRGCDSAQHAGATGFGAHRVGRHRARGRFGCGGGDAAAMAGAGAQCAHPDQAACLAEHGKPEIAGFGRRHAGPDAGPAELLVTAGGSGRCSGAGTECACSRSHLREPADARNAGGNRGRDADESSSLNGQCAGAAAHGA